MSDQPEAYKRKLIDGVEYIEIEALDDLTDAVNAFAEDHAAFIRVKSIQNKQGVKPLIAMKLFKRFYETFTRWQAFKVSFYGEAQKQQALREEILNLRKDAVDDAIEDTGLVIIGRG